VKLSEGLPHRRSYVCRHGLRYAYRGSLGG
jgi:hypothetical protein